MTKDLPRAALIPLLLATAGAAAGEAHCHAPAASPAGVLQFGPYDLLRELGRGGMGTVYLAEERDHARRLVALKVAHRAPDSGALHAQLAFERHALASLDHEHVVRLFDAGTTPDGHPWLAMEYVDGEPIDAYCTRKALPLKERVHLLATVARAVHHLHERGIVHRDLKPENILVTETHGQPVPKLIDLGFATLQHTDERDPTTHTVVGTPAYMAPELFAGQPATPDPRSDVFALGVVLYELVCGTSPFGRPSSGQVEIEIGNRNGIPDAAHADGDDRRARAMFRSGLDAAVQHALANDPDRRPRHAGALAHTLDAVLERSERRLRMPAWVERVLAVLGLGK